MCIEFFQHGPVSELVALTGTWRATLNKSRANGRPARQHVTAASSRCESKVCHEF